VNLIYQILEISPTKEESEGTNDFASRIVVKTNGGIQILWLNFAVEGFWSGTTNALTSLLDWAPFKSCHAGTWKDCVLAAEVGSIRYTSAWLLSPQRPNTFDSEQKMFCCRKQTLCN
jgi:hypothetical protein